MENSDNDNSQNNNEDDKAAHIRYKIIFVNSFTITLIYSVLMVLVIKSMKKAKKIQIHEIVILLAFFFTFMSKTACDSFRVFGYRKFQTVIFILQTIIFVADRVKCMIIYHYILELREIKMKVSA